jgi:hypothetical protein
VEQAQPDRYRPTSLAIANQASSISETHKKP